MNLKKAVLSPIGLIVLFSGRTSTLSDHRASLISAATGLGCSLATFCAIYANERDEYSDKVFADGWQRRTVRKTEEPFIKATVILGTGGLAWALTHTFLAPHTPAGKLAIFQAQLDDNAFYLDDYAKSAKAFLQNDQEAVGQEAELHFPKAVWPLVLARTMLAELYTSVIKKEHVLTDVKSLIEQYVSHPEPSPSQKKAAVTFAGQLPTLQEKAESLKSALKKSIDLLTSHPHYQQQYLLYTTPPVKQKHI